MWLRPCSFSLLPAMWSSSSSVHLPCCVVCLVQRLVDAAAKTRDGSKHDGDGWAEALEALNAAAPALGVRLDAWAGLAAGEVGAVR